MGLNFKKELVVDEVVVFPAGVRDAPPPTRLQERLLNKLGKARRYYVTFKENYFLLGGIKGINFLSLLQRNKEGK